MENLQKAIDATKEKNAIDFKQVISAELADRLYKSINTKKESISGSMTKKDETPVEAEAEEDAAPAVSEANVLAPSAPVSGGKVGIPGSERSNSGAGEIPDPLEGELKDEIENAFGLKGDSDKMIAKDDDISLDPNFEKEFYMKEMDYNGHKVTLKQIGLGLSKPVRVYVDNKRWEFFPGPEAAMKASKSYIDGMDKQESVNTSEAVTEAKVDLDGRSRLYKSTVARLEQARVRRETHNSKVKELEENSTMTNQEILDAVNMKNGKFVMGEEELSDKQSKYRKFFSAALKKHGASSPTELSGEKRKQFFNYVKANWKG